MNTILFSVYRLLGCHRDYKIHYNYFSNIRQIIRMIPSWINEGVEKRMENE